MYVLSAPLEPADAESLRRACAQSRLELRTATPDSPAEVLDDLIVAFYREGAPPPADHRILRDRRVHTVLVRPSVSGPATLAAVRDGYRFVFSTPLATDRLAKLLTYLREVAPAPLARVLRLDEESGTLSTPSASVTLDQVEAAAVRLFGERPDRIVSRAELTTACGGFDPLLVVAQLRRRFDEIGSGAQILKVPHMGFRLVGEVRAVDDDSAVTSRW